jgi:hypothetical protein
VGENGEIWEEGDLSGKALIAKARVEERQHRLEKKKRARATAEVHRLARAEVDAGSDADMERLIATMAVLSMTTQMSINDLCT